jgi:hypothetical protein
MMNKTLLLLVLLLLIIFVGPILTIWSLNTLFPVLAIPYSIETWCAAGIIAGVIRGDSLSFGRK